MATKNYAPNSICLRILVEDNQAATEQSAVLFEPARVKDVIEADVCL